MVSASGSPNTVNASSKETPCFDRLARAFFESHSNCTLQSTTTRYGPKTVTPGVRLTPALSGELLIGNAWHFISPSPL